MNIADGMKSITGNIIASHQVRTKTLGSLISDVNRSLADTRRMMRDNAAGRKAMSKEQSAELARFAGDLAGSIGAKLKGFKKELDLISKDRVLNAQELKARLRKEAKDLRNSVKKTMADFNRDHAEMSEALRSNLRGFVKDVVAGVEGLTRATRGMMSDYRSDIRKAGNIWGNMTNVLAATVGKKARLPLIQAEEKSGTVAEAVHKIHKRKKRKK